MLKVPCVYTITNLVNNKQLVGYTSSFRRRKNEHFSHLRKNQHRNEHLQRAFNKYGEENFKMEILEEYPNEGYILPSMENYWVNILRTNEREYGYNILPTDPYNARKVSEETRVKLSLKNKGKIRTEEQKQKIREKRKIQIISKESYNKAKETRKLKTKENGYYHSPETIQKIKIAKTGKKCKKNKEEMRISTLAGIKKKIEKYGYFISPEGVESIKKHSSERNSKPVLQFTKSGKFIKEWKSAVEASKELKINSKNISSAANNYRKSAGGFLWKKKEDESDK